MIVPALNPRLEREWFLDCGAESAALEICAIPREVRRELILKTIALEPMHGWAIAQRIRLLSADVLQVQQGSLYPALHKLEHQGFIKAAWDLSDNNRRAKYYSLTRAGEKRLAHELESWERLSAAVTMVARTSEL